MRIVIAFSIGVILSPFLSAQSHDTLFYSYVNNGKIVGKQWVCEKEKNSYDYYDEYNDRGRGPAIYGHINTAEDGAIIFSEFRGVDYYKAEVNEKFYVRNGKAFWKNKFENDSAVFRNELYSDINGPVAEYELILKMISKSPSANLNVLPAGIRSFKQITSIQIDPAKKENERIPATTAGKRQSQLYLNLIAFSGFGGTPSYFWFTKEGRFFGVVSDWSSLVIKGNEGLVKDLYTIQKGFEEKYYKGLAVSLTEKNEQGLAIKNANLFDPEKGILKENQTVLIHQGIVEKTGSSSDITIPPGYKIVDGANKFLMPGLWDMHAHFSRDQGPFMLAQGVTNIRDMGNSSELLNIRNSINKDSLLGPDISVISGFIDKTGPMAAPTGALVKSLDEALKAVQDYKDQGYDQIKLYSSIEPGWVKPIAAKAHQLGMRVCGHIPAFMTASQAIYAGYDEVTHINMLFLNFFGDSVDTRNMTRLTLPGEKGYAIDIEGEAVGKFIDQLKQYHTVLDPTLSAFEDNYLQLPGQLSGAYKPIAAHLPPEIRRFQLNGAFLGSDSMVNTYALSFLNMKKMVKKLYDDGLIILSGTDGGILQHELELYSDAGIPNAAVLKMATYWPARVHGKEAELGTVSAGKRANLILVDGNPLQNIRDIRRVYLTVKDGKIYWPREIYKNFGWGYYY